MRNGGIERASIAIDAPIEVVWSIFTDVERWPTWASSFTSVELIDGPMRLGAKARIRQPRLPTVVWEVTKWEPGRSWTWTATSPGARTEASHVLTRSGDGTVAEQSIVASGPLGRLAAFVWRSLTQRYLAIEAAGLRFRPVMMTSFAFILGLFPLVVAQGAGAVTRHAVGTPVFGGMIAASVFGIFIIPLLYIIAERLRGRSQKTK